MSMGVLLAVVVILLIALIAILLKIFSGDGPGGPVIVIEPGDGQGPGMLLNTVRVTWSIDWYGRKLPIRPHGKAGSPPSIPLRFLHSNGVELIAVCLELNDGFPRPTRVFIHPKRVELKIDSAQGTNTVLLEFPVVNQPAKWFLNGGIVVRNQNENVQWPEEFLGTLTSVKVDEYEAISRFKGLYIKHNKRWSSGG